MRARPVFAGDIHLITRRVNAFLCRLRPGEDVRRVITYCLARAARRHGIEVIAFAIMSTHLHMVIRDPRGVLPRFCQEFFTNVARALNFEQGTGGIVFEPGSYRRQTLDTPKGIYKEIAYTMANPVAAGLVSEPRRWPGLITLPSDLGKRTYRARRPKFFRDPGEEGESEGALTGDETARDRHRMEHSEECDDDLMQDEESLTLSLPPCLPDGTTAKGRGDDVRRAAADWLERELEGVHEERRREGKRSWVGVDRVKQQDPHKPHREDLDRRPTGELNPQFVTQDRTAGRESALTLRAWRQEYGEAWVRWKSGDRSAVFPCGAWLAPRVWGAQVRAKPA